MENSEEGEGEGRSKRQRLEEEEALNHEDDGTEVECEGSRGVHGRHGAGSGDGDASETVHLPANRFGVQCLRARDKIHAVERDYSHHYIIGVGGEAGSDQIVFQHFNKLCLIGLAPSHASMANGRRIVEVDFEVGRAGDKSGRVSGKKKIGAA